ncbi:MAG: hypothetical protein ACI841_001292 [Planctomycetota bacterium]|jgi:hypothetical protein
MDGREVLPIPFIPAFRSIRLLSHFGLRRLREIQKAAFGSAEHQALRGTAESCAGDQSDLPASCERGVLFCSPRSA